MQFKRIDDILVNCKYEGEINGRKKYVMTVCENA